MGSSGDPIILTGAASGVGDATARQLIERGHQVISLDIKEPRAGVAAHHHCDLSDPASIDAAVAKASLFLATTDGRRVGALGGHDAPHAGQGAGLF